MSDEAHRPDPTPSDLILPPRFNVLGVGVSALALGPASALVVASARARTGGYVCFADVNSLSCARRDPAHRRILNASRLTTPDGMPLVWLGRRAGHRGITRVYGPDLLEAVCAATAGTGLTHFFYGAGPGTAPLLAARLTQRFPGLQVAGTHTPPHGPLPAAELARLTETLSVLRPDFFWVGLSTPKQEAFMAAHAAGFNVGVMLGVGAAFDLLSGRVRQAPRWVRHGGGEWLFRLAIEPRRLAPRYLKNNPLFVLRVLAQLSGLKKYPVG